MKSGKLCASNIQEWGRHRIDIPVSEREKYKKPRRESQETIILGGVAERGEKGNMRTMMKIPIHFES